MRRAFLGEAPYPIEVGELWFDADTALATGQSIPQGLCFIAEPTSARCFVVNLPLRLKATRYACVIPILIPNPSDGGGKHLSAVQSLLKRNPGINIHIYQVNNPLLQLRDKLLPTYLG